MMIEKNSENQFLIKGVLDFDNLSAMLKQACAIIDHEMKETIFNFSELAQCNSAGLSLLISLVRYANEKRKNIRFLHLPGKLWAAAKISDLDKVLPCEQM